MRRFSLLVSLFALLAVTACAGSDVLTAPVEPGLRAAVQDGTDPSSNNSGIRLFEGTDPSSNNGNGGRP